jgi:hypothetical protein
LHHHIPVAAFCGTSDLNNSSRENLGVKFIEQLVSESVTKEEAINNAKQVLREKAKDFFKQFTATGSH